MTDMTKFREMLAGMDFLELLQASKDVALMLDYEAGRMERHQKHDPFAALMTLEMSSGTD